MSNQENVLTIESLFEALKASQKIERFHGTIIARAENNPSDHCGVKQTPDWQEQNILDQKCSLVAEWVRAGILRIKKEPRVIYVNAYEMLDGRITLGDGHDTREECEELRSSNTVIVAHPIEIPE